MNRNTIDKKYELVLDTEKVKDCLFDKGLTKKAFAKELGIDEHTLSKYLRNPSCLRLSQVADIALVLKGEAYYADDFIKLVERD